MTPKQIELVRNSFRAAAPQRHRLAGAFFAELFAREPSLRPLFAGALSLHGVKLFDGLAEIVGSLDRLYPIVPVLEWLAIRNLRRGVGERQYRAFGEALRTTLEAALGASFTAETGEAWIAAERAVLRVMCEALAAEPIAA
ncbi:MAG TPA: globin domain-containing protein [Allosphingosinicella sp.]|nr:globin domain-containing protein [Allosphingosinicella sp.]